MPGVTSAEVTIYKVWTQICPQPITIILLVNPSLTVTASLIWGLWGLQMAGDAWSPQMAVSEPLWLLVNPTGPN